MTEDDKSYFNSKIEELKKIKESKEFATLDTIISETNTRMSNVGSRVYISQQNSGNSGANSNPFGGMNGANFNDVFGQFAQQFGGNGTASTQSDNSTNSENKPTDFEEVK